MSLQHVSMGGRNASGASDNRGAQARAAYANTAWRNANAAPCLLCGEAPEPKWRIPCDWRTSVNEEFVLGWCRRCAFGQLLERPTPDAAARHYQVDYHTHATHAIEKRSEVAPTAFDRLRMHLAWRLDRGSDVDQLLATLPPQQSICEIGCGHGERLATLHALGHHVAGIEPDRVAWQRATRLVPDVHRCTVEQLPAALASQSFDLVVMHHVLEHCIDPVLALRNVKRLLKPGGSLLIEVPNNQARGARAAKSGWRWLDVPRHLNFFTKQSLISACGKAGMRVCGVQYYGYARQFDNEWLAAEQHISQRMHLSRAPSKAGVWRLLLTTAFAAPEKKYDSLRVVAVL